MPPFVPRKRIRDTSVTPKASSSSPQTAKQTKPQAATPRKKSLFDAIDAASTLRGNLAQLLEEDEHDSTSSLTSLSDAEFEDVPIAKRRKIAQANDGTDDEDDVDVDGSDEDDEDIEFEDVQTPLLPLPEAPLPSGDLDLTLVRDTRISLINAFGKKGPSKRERLTRSATHRLHVMFLMWHNSVRNSWISDPEVLGLLLSHLPWRLWEEVERWRRASGLVIPEGELPSRRTTQAKGKGKANGKGKSKENSRPTKAAERRSREWSGAAQRLEVGVVDMSHGDPLFRLMGVLTAWWKQRFKISAPGIRKLGYMSLERLDYLQKAFKDEGHDAFKFGERIPDLEHFRRCARDLNGSRDVGAQLFTALLRGLGLEARMVANLQPLGFGWNKLEEADPEEEEEGSEGRLLPSKLVPSKTESKPKPKTELSVKSTSSTPSGIRMEREAESLLPALTRQSGRKRDSTRGVKSEYFELAEINSDDDLVVEVPRKAPPKDQKTFDKDLDFPHYWTEVLSPVTNKYLVVDPIVKTVVATNRELVETLEPRGGKADKARQVMAYVVGFSPDGTAKDVTVRYLKRQVLPGRTKGVRYPTQKVPVYNKHGKVKHYDQVDWCKSVMRGYVRGSRSHPITEVDEDEDATDLKPAKHMPKEIKEGEETLQYYKQSQEFVLERHLKREEALGPKAKPVKVFRNNKKGKGGGGGGQASEENVYLRKHVVQVKSAETWHKQGRAPKPGERPLKNVPHRAATLNRKREIAEAEAASGQKVLQGLFSYEQTDWIIPPPIRDGVIPKNEYGNIDLFVEHMLPRGAVHLPYRGVAKVCRRLEVDFAEAVVDFEFGHRMAVPVIQGCVVAEEHKERVMEALARDEAERTRREDEKRTRAALGMWRRMLMGLRIVERLREDYGEGVGGAMHIFGSSTSAAKGGGGGGSSHAAGGSGGKAEAVAENEDEDMAGGFLPPGFEEEEEEEVAPPQTSTFFPAAHEDDEEDEHAEHGLLVEDDRRPFASSSGQAPAVVGSRPGGVAPQAGKPARKAAAKSRQRSRRRVASDEDEGEDEDDDDNDSDQYDEDYDDGSSIY